MKIVTILILCLMLSGCVMRFKGKELEWDGRPLSKAEQEIELYGVDIF